MSLPITVGNWTLNPLHVDSVATPKQIQITDVRSEEFSTSSASPLKEQKIDTDQSLYFTDSTGSQLYSPGLLAIGRSRVRNIYGVAEDIPTSARLPQTNGVRVYIRAHLRYSAVNSVSGEEDIIPLPLSFSVVVPSWASLPVDILTDAMNHFIGTLYMGSGVTLPQIVINAVKGDIDVTR